jgi:two-component system response regulator HydG
MECFISDGALSSDCLELVLETMAEGVIFIDTKHNIQYCNKTAEIMSGLSKDEIIGKPCSEFLMCNANAECTLFLDGNINGVECSLQHSAGHTLDLVKSGRIVTIAGKIAGAVETFSDVSNLRAKENRISELEEIIRKKGGVPHLIAKSHAMDKVFEQINFAANSNANTYIYGESGTGKELTSRAIHDLSARKDFPFVAINCSALPENLLESELFGHIKGAFTGAIADKKGRFELAEGGTLFLDEIADVSPLIQVKLLRFLQEKEFERVGDGVTRKANVRIVTASNRDLKDLVHTGEFREDLYYRLNVFPIVLPPLRSRKDDIPVLVEHFIKKYNDETGKEIKTLSSDALLTLMDYHWPGNVRQLENSIEHAFVTCQVETIDMFNLPLEIRQNEVRLNVAKSGGTPHFETGSQEFISAPKKRMNKEKLTTLLNEFEYNRSDLSKYLEVDRSTLWRWMKKWGIEDRE